MKPTLALSILLAMSASALAQSPTVVEKPAPKGTTANVKVVPQTAKPSPANVKVVAVPAKPAPAAAKPAVVATKPAVVPAKPGVVAVPAAPAKTVAVQPSKAAPSTTSTGVKAVAAPAGKTTAVPAHAAAVVAKPGVKPVAAAPGKPAVQAKSPFNKQAQPVPAKAGNSTVVAVKDNKPAENKKPEPKKINAAGRRDPFVSPVVNLGAVGSGCSSGKRCLAIDQVALKGVVKSDTGMIAVVVNAMDKAYFLRENDPVFNGYVVKITGDSIVFKETFKDKLGKPLTRDVTKTITRPVA